MTLQEIDIEKIDFSDTKQVKEIIIFLLTTVKEQAEIISKNSHNSSKPPSSDGPGKPKRSTDAISKRKNTRKRKSGGQKGHKGHHLKMVENPDEIKNILVEKCEHCNHNLEDTKATSYRRRQLLKLPKIKITVLEYRAEEKTCSCCGKKTKAKFPDNIKAPTQYGNNFKSFINYIKNYQLIPDNRVVEFVQDVFNHKISEGTIHNMTKALAGKLEKPVSQIKEMLQKSKVIGNDESGIRINGDNYWLQNTSTDFLTYYDIHKKRGKEAMDAIGILPFFMGTVVHDFYGSYFQYDFMHGLCNAHIIRELIFSLEERSQDWAGKMIDFLLDLKEEVESKKEKGKTELSNIRLKRLENKYFKILDIGFEINPFKAKDSKKRGRPKQTKERNLLTRMANHQEEILAFAYNFDVPFDNNLSERDIRMIKLKQKISGCFRSFEGAKLFCTIRSYISTARKNRINILDAFNNAFENQAFVPILSE